MCLPRLLPTDGATVSTLTHVSVTNVYIDGFNLYYGQLKGVTGVKWLNLESLAEKLLPSNEVKRVRYFTARVKPRPDDPQVNIRQDAYLRALTTLPRVTVHLGTFLTKPVRMPLTQPLPSGARTVEVLKTEEKGSDVNLATYLLVDAFRRDAETFVVVTNDSDLMEPLRIVRHELGQEVGLLNPQKESSLALLKCEPSFVGEVRRGALAASQFPDAVNYLKPSGKEGVVRRPKGW